MPKSTTGKYTRDKYTHTWPLNLLDLWIKYVIVRWKELLMDKVQTFSVKLTESVNVAEAMMMLDGMVKELGDVVIKSVSNQRFDDFLTRTVVYIPASPTRRRVGIRS